MTFHMPMPLPKDIGARGFTPNKYIKAGALGALVNQLDELGLDDALPNARHWLNRANELRAEPGPHAKAAREEADAIPARIADGEVSAIDAATRLAELAPLLDTERNSISDLTKRAATECEGRAVVAASGEANAVHTELAKLAASAVEEAVAAAGTLINAAEHARRAAALRWVEGEGWSDKSLLALDADHTDPARASALAQAHAATLKYEQIHEVGEKLRKIVNKPAKQPLAVRLGCDPLPNADTLQRFEQIPRPLRLAVYSAAEMKPGYYAVAAPRKRLAERFLDQIKVGR